MSDIKVRVLGDEDWETYRDIRLSALQESPEAFAASASDEREQGEDFWRRRMARSRRLVGERDGTPVGVVSVGHVGEGDERGAELFGLWVTPDLRGQGVSWTLVESGVEQARSEGLPYVIYWVGTDNARAVAFASSFGFRPTDHRRPMQAENASGDEDDDNLEMAMVYPLSDVTTVPSSAL